MSSADKLRRRQRQDKSRKKNRQAERTGVMWSIYIYVGKKNENERMEKKEEERGSRGRRGGGLLFIRLYPEACCIFMKPVKEGQHSDSEHSGLIHYLMFTLA